MSHLQSIERACQKAIPSILTHEIEHYQWPECAPEIEPVYRPITLQDILLCLWDDWAMQTWNNQHFSGQFYPKLWYDRIHDGDGLQILRGNTFWLSDMYPNDIPRYDLTKSPYDQLPEVLQFLAENLTK